MKKEKKILMIGIMSLLLSILWTNSVHLTQENYVIDKNELQVSLLTEKNTKMISPYETAKYINDKTFQMIKKADSKIDFYGVFNQGNLSKYDYYRKLFKKLLDKKAKLLVKSGNQNYYYNIDEYGGLSDDYDKNKHDYSYIFFDIDGDNAPELCIKDNASFTYVIDYDEDAKEFVLWQDSNIQILGAKKYSVESYPINIFIELDKYGKDERLVRFLTNEYTDSISGDRRICFSVTLPYKDESEIKDLQAPLKEQAYWDPSDECYYFRVTDEQYYDLSKDFFVSRRLAEEHIKDVTYTYNELFGDLTD